MAKRRLARENVPTLRFGLTTDRAQAPRMPLAIACRYPRSKSPPNSTIPTPIVNVHYVLPIVLSFPNELLPAAPTTAVVPEIREEWGH
ncbi:unnamed protein product [Peniophora sp. CBMAI 1063]|nr:unnamed protein product [Peniophora sp. CBMAI 1063]